MQRSARVAVVRLSAMGDVVQSSAAVLALHEARPELAIAWVVQRPFAALLESLFDDAVGPEPLPFDRRGGPRAYLRCARALRAWRPDVVLDLQGNWKSAGLAWLSGARRRIGVGRSVRREPSSALLLTETVAAGGHAAEQAFAVAAAVEPGLRARPPALAARPAEVERERDALRALGIDCSKPFCVLVLGDERDPRSIRPAALAREAAAAELPCVAVAGPAEAAVPAPPGVPRLAHERGEPRRLIALGAVVAQAGGRVIGPDKGATHVLAAAGARTTALFGPTEPSRSGPPAARALLAADAPPCRPCGRRRCEHPSGPVCMDFTVASAPADPTD